MFWTNKKITFLFLVTKLNKWRFYLFIINLKLLRMVRWGVQIPNKAGSEMLNGAGAYCEEYVRDATCMCATTCLPIQTVFCLAIKYWTQGSKVSSSFSFYNCKGGGGRSWNFVFHKLLWYIWLWRLRVAPWQVIIQTQKSYAIHKRQRSCLSL